MGVQGVHWLLELQQGLAMWNSHMAMCQPSDMVIDTNMSLSSWGGCILDSKSTVVGWWKASTCHINSRPSRKHTTHSNPRSWASILIHCNNITVITYMNKMGGQNLHLNQVMHKIFMFMYACGIHLIAHHLPGTMNMWANRLSRLLLHEWQVHHLVFKALQWKWGPHSIDCMATKWNTLLLHFNLRFWEHHIKATNALTQNWANDNNWVAPPLALMPVVMWLLHQQNTHATVLAPAWTSKAWCQELLELCNELPLLLPHPAPLIPLNSMKLEPLCCGNWCMAIFRTSGKATPGGGTQRPWQCSTLHWPLLHGVITAAV